MSAITKTIVSIGQLRSTSNISLNIQNVCSMIGDAAKSGSKVHLPCI